MKLLALAVVLCIAVPAAANPKKQAAEAAYKQGQAQYMKEDFAAAVVSFKTAYDADPDPVYLFNIAQAYRMAKKCVEAGDYYRRFLRAAPNAPNADTVKASIDEVDDCAKKAGLTPITEPPPDKPVEPPVEEKPLDTQPIPEQPERGGSNKRLFSYVLGGVGLVGIGVGAYFVKRISDKEEEARTECNADDAGNCQRFSDKLDDIESTAKTYEKIMVTSFVVGGAALAAGVVLFVMGGESQQESAVTIAPTRDGAMATYAFEF